MTKQIKQKLKEKMKLLDNLNQSKWMRYETDIIKYYYPMLQKWLNEGMKKPSTLQFTSGLGRDIARLMEEANTFTEKNCLKEVGKKINIWAGKIKKIALRTKIDKEMFDEDIKELKKEIKLINKKA